MLSQQLAADHYNYGTYTARFGNQYTARQLLQTIRRAHGKFEPVEDVWEGDDGELIDPYRPRIQPGGFASQLEYDLDREQHFDAIRRMVSDLDVLVFTLGLTEAWESIEDGAIFPLCPGTAGGAFDPERHRFVNFDVDDVAADLEALFAELRELNPSAKLLLTVSPVPLVATATEQHVLTATTYSKSVLRVAAQRVADGEPDIDYFPSYEIITSPYSRGKYFEADLRSVTRSGVSHVMDLFFHHYAGRDVNGSGAPHGSAQASAEPEVINLANADSSNGETGRRSEVGGDPADIVVEDEDVTAADDVREMDEAMDVLCDLEALDPA